MTQRNGTGREVGGGFRMGNMCVKKGKRRISLVVQWLRIHLPMQGTWVPSLVQEDPTYLGATKIMPSNY